MQLTVKAKAYGEINKRRKHNKVAGSASSKAINKNGSNSFSSHSFRKSFGKQFILKSSIVFNTKITILHI